MDCEGRQRKLRAELDRRKVDALVVTHLPNVRYLCGFTGSAGVLLVARRPVFFTDGRYAEQASAEVHDARISVVKSGTLPAVAATCAKLGLKRVAIESRHLRWPSSEALNRRWARESNLSGWRGQWKPYARRRMPMRLHCCATPWVYPRGSSVPC